MKTYGNQPSGTIDRARQLRRESTTAERRLLRELRERLPSSKWRHQMPIGPYFADIACFASRLVIELDGGQHAAARDYDAARTRFIEAQGFRVMRFWNNDVTENLDGVLEVVASAHLPLPPGEGRGEGDQASDQAAPSPSPPSAGPLPLPAGEGI